MRRSLAWFVAVGCAAAAVHFAAVVLLVTRGGLHPLWANVAAWCVAFGVSWSGHRWLSFRQQAAPKARSAARFALVSLGGLAVNEAAYAVLLHATGLRYEAALAIVLLAVAALTYWLGRHWAFAGSRGSGP